MNDISIEPGDPDSPDLVTHAVCVGMTGSGKTGLCIDLLEEAAIDGVPALVIDPKGDLGNLLLTFPNLAPADFRPWIDEDEARRNGKSSDEWAAAQADLWKKGLASWDQDGDRITRLKAAADFAIYTPGSTSGLPISILKSFSAPSQDFIDESDLMRERVATTATSLLGLIGVDADPIKSREHILLSNIIDVTWRKGQDLDIASLIGLIQTPPMQKVGVLDLEAFFPSAKRFELAMALNNLLASPGFSAWLEGEPLDIASLLHTPAGKPRVAIMSIAHLNDAERMFFVALLLNQVLGWMRQQPGTSSLRAIVYMDEIAGYLPPVANPASKGPMLTLLKQARAFGVGMVLATQNPVDLDYKALSNAGTWFIGRLQTERDQARVLDGLEGATTTAGAEFDRGTMSKLITGLGKRQFLLHNVHEDHPATFESRWAMSYLRGPLTRVQIKALMGGRATGSGLQAPDAGGRSKDRPYTASAAGSPESEAQSPAAVGPIFRLAKSGALTSAPVLPPDVKQYFAPAGTHAAYQPMVLAVAKVHYADAKSGVDTIRQTVFVAPITADPIPVDWAKASAAGFTVDQLATAVPSGATFADLPTAANKSRNYADWSKAFVTWLSASQPVTLFRSQALGLTSTADETEGAFRVRLQQASREKRDAATAALRQSVAGKLASLQTKLQAAQQKVATEQGQRTAQGVQAAISIGASIFSAFMGRKTLSAANVGRATTAFRSAGRVVKDQQDVGVAQEGAAAVQQQIDQVNSDLAAQIAALDVTYNPQTATLDSVAVKAKRTDVNVQLVALVWVADQ